MNKIEYTHIRSLLDKLTFKFTVIEGSTTTACWAFLPNGFQLGYGESACVDPNNFDKDLGEKYAKERCITKATDNLWLLEGYLLKVTGKDSSSF